MAPSGLVAALKALPSSPTRPEEEEEAAGRAGVCGRLLVDDRSLAEMAEKLL